MPPPQPWSLDALSATFGALDELTAAATPCPVPGLVPFAEQYRAMFTGFRQLAGGHGPRTDLDAWTQRHLGVLAELESEWEPASRGASLVHGDIRADNLLVSTDGRVFVVDWAHASVGAEWLDKLCMLPSVGLGGGPSPSEVDAALRPFRGADPDAVDRVLVALAGFFTHQGGQPDPPGLPTVRAYQRAQGEIARQWLAARTGLR